MASVNLGKVVGDSAYEVAVAQGYTGTESEWLASLKGADGFSPIATVVKTDSVATITITDINGTTTASVYDGTGGGGSSYTDADTAAYIKNTFGMSEDHEDVCSGETIVTGSNLATPIQAADWVNNTELTADVFAETYPYFWITSQYNEGPHSFKAYIDGYGMGGCQYVGELGAGVSLTMTVSVDMDFDTDSDLGNPKITRFDLDDGGSSVSTELPMTIWFDAKTPLNDMFIPSEIVRSIQLEEALPQPDGETIVRNENNVWSAVGGSSYSDADTLQCIAENFDMGITHNSQSVDSSAETIEAGASALVWNDYAVDITTALMGWCHDDQDNGELVFSINPEDWQSARSPQPTYTATYEFDNNTYVVQINPEENYVSVGIDGTDFNSRGFVDMNLNQTTETTEYVPLNEVFIPEEVMRKGEEIELSNGEPEEQHEEVSIQAEYVSVQYIELDGNDDPYVANKSTLTASALTFEAEDGSVTGELSMDDRDGFLLWNGDAVAIASDIPEIPHCDTTTDGTFMLVATVSSGDVAYTWEPIATASGVSF